MDWGTRITYLASTALRERTTPFGIKDSDRMQHLCVLGRVGSGRAALLARIALQDMERGIGVVILDAAGNLGPLIMERLPEGVRDRVVHLDAADAEYPFSWNSVDEFRASSVGKEIFLDALPSVYGVARSDLTTFAAEYILRTPTATVIDLYTMVADEKARAAMMPLESSDLAKLTSLIEAEKESVKTILESGRYLAKDTMVRNLVGQEVSKVSLAALSDGALIILDLSRIRIFPTRIAPLVKLFTYATRARTNATGIPAALFVHDCLRYYSEHDTELLFSDHSLALSLSDTVYRESDLPLREKSLARCGSMVAFQPHQADITLVEKAFYPYVTPEELAGLEAGEACVSLTIDSVKSRPFFAQALELPERKNVSLQDLFVASRQKYTTARAAVDKAFKKVVEKEDKGPGTPGSGPKNPGQFSDAFKSIFNKKQAALGAKPAAPAQDAAPVAEQGPQTAAETPPQPQPAPVVAPTPPAPSAKEVPEADLRQLLYVGPIPA